ncbi:methyltransferase domain-containing protein [Flavobacterium amnicola]|uniref:Methyltransferase domain-containing protein n=1 Tax=Flavobacterium amnicola TaxID=2506422 RepID=A0A4Q1K303_9FLAO|nr:fused MFS/spermidine synthase [Flavobacterium amnicola]RXR18912.1 methyltransferase domain-containing protein [Flavobacterium amnicola]
MNFKRLLSYILPIKIYQTASKINQNLEVTWNNGQLVLDSKNTNFSFGSLERVMRIGLNTLGKEKITTYQSVLVLGVGGGSVIKLLQDEIQFGGKIIGIELDPKVIEIANQYFGLDKRKNIEINLKDAFEFVKNTTTTYDLIVIDIFQDKIMPDFLFSEPFIFNLNRILSKKGSVLFNSIVTLSVDFERNAAYNRLVAAHFSSVQRLSNVEGDNELFILRK